MLFEGNTAKAVLSPERLSELLTAGKIEFPTVTVEEIEDRSKADPFSKTIALGQTLWFVMQCIARGAQHLDLTLVELLTLSLAVLNGTMYFLWWHKPLDVRCPVRVYLIGDYDEPIVGEPNESVWGIGNVQIRRCISRNLREASKSSRHLAIPRAGPLHPNQDLDINS